MAIKEILNEYDKKRELYKDYTSLIEALTKTLVIEKDLKFHSIASRTKTRISLEKKASDAEKYKAFKDITDISGVRLITFFADEVDIVKSIIEAEYEVVEIVDKRVKEPDRFGYVSLHIIAKLSSKRTGLSEYKRFANLIFEIQVRSILQHAWAEIEHDLGYENKVSVPVSHDIRERFSCLAASLTSGDREFMRIRDELSKYKKELPEAIANRPDSVLIDKESLLAFINENSLVQEMDLKFAEHVDTKGKKITEASGPTVEEAIKIFGFLKIKTIKELEVGLEENKDSILLFGKKLLERMGGEDGGFSVRRGYSVHLLRFFILARDFSKIEIVKIFKKFSVIPEDEGLLAGLIVDCYLEIPK